MFLRRAKAKKSKRGELMFVVGIFVCLKAFVFSAFGQNFPFVSEKRIADIYVANDDFKVVKIAAEAFAADIESIADRKPNVRNSVENLSKNIVIGTLGKTRLIESLIENKKLDVSRIVGKRGCFTVRRAQKSVSESRARARHRRQRPARNGVRRV